MSLHRVISPVCIPFSAVAKLEGENKNVTGLVSLKNFFVMSFLRLTFSFARNFFLFFNRQTSKLGFLPSLRQQNPNCVHPWTIWRGPLLRQLKKRLDFNYFFI